MKLESKAHVVTAFHGTSEATAKAVLDGEPLKPSNNIYDWLGSGIYFFQDREDHAWRWARGRFAGQAAVLVAKVDTQGFISTSSPSWKEPLEAAYEEYVARCNRLGIALERQTSVEHSADCGVMNWFVRILENSGLSVPGVSGVFLAGEPLYPGSYFYPEGHVQLAVRDPSRILELGRADSLDERLIGP